MVYVNTYIDIEFDDVWDGLSTKEQKEFISDVLFEQSEMVPEGWHREEQPIKLAIEDDGPYRLEVITWLRANGWTVEPNE